MLELELLEVARKWQEVATPILGTGTLESSHASSQVASQRSLTPRAPPGIKATTAVINKTVKPLPASPQDGRGGGGRPLLSLPDTAQVCLPV